MISDNAPFNEFGHTQVLRALEQLDLRLTNLQGLSSDMSGGSSPSGAKSNLTPIGLIAANNLIDVPDKILARINLGLGSAATASAGSFLTVANNLSDLNSAVTARANLGLGSAATQATSAFLQPGNNLSDVSNAGTARGNLGLGSMAVQNSNSVSISGGNITSNYGTLIGSAGGYLDAKTNASLTYLHSTYFGYNGGGTSTNRLHILGSGSTSTTSSTHLIEAQGPSVGSFPSNIQINCTFGVQSIEVYSQRIVLDGSTSVSVGDGSGGTVGFFGGTGTGQPVVSGSRGGNAALLSLITALKNMNLILDTTT